MAFRTKIVPSRIESRIYVLRGQRVMLDADLAALYGVETKALNQAVARNPGRFPADFAFRLTVQDVRGLKSQFVTSNGRGGRRRSLPRAFTEQGVAMLSSVLHSPRAIAANVEIMRAFVRLRRLHGEYAELAQRIYQLEAKYDASFKAVFDAIRELMRPPSPSRRPIGFQPRR